MSLWRKRQITDKEREEIEAIKQRARDIYTRIHSRSRFDEALTSLFDVFLLCTGFALCSYSFGLPAGLGLGLLALFARGEL